MQYTTKYEYDEIEYEIRFTYQYHSGIESYYTAYGWTAPEYDWIELWGVEVLTPVTDELKTQIINSFVGYFDDSKLYEDMLYIAREEFA